MRLFFWLYLDPCNLSVASKKSIRIVGISRLTAQMLPPCLLKHTIEAAASFEFFCVKFIIKLAVHLSLIARRISYLVLLSHMQCCAGMCLDHSGSAAQTHTQHVWSNYCLQGVCGRQNVGRDCRLTRLFFTCRSVPSKTKLWTACCVWDGMRSSRSERQFGIEIDFDFHPTSSHQRWWCRTDWKNILMQLCCCHFYGN